MDSSSEASGSDTERKQAKKRPGMPAPASVELAARTASSEQIVSRRCSNGISTHHCRQPPRAPVISQPEDARVPLTAQRNVQLAAWRMANDVIQLGPPRAAVHGDDPGDSSQARFFRGLPQPPASLAASVIQSPRDEVGGVYPYGRLNPPTYISFTAVRDEHGGHNQDQFFEHYLLCDGGENRLPQEL